MLARKILFASLLTTLAMPPSAARADTLPAPLEASLARAMESFAPTDSTAAQPAITRKPLCPASATC